MARRPNELFDKNKIKKQCDDVSISCEPMNAVLEWLKLLKEDKSLKEKMIGKNILKIKISIF